MSAFEDDKDDYFINFKPELDIFQYNTQDYQDYKQYKQYNNDEMLIQIVQNRVRCFLPCLIEYEGIYYFIKDIVYNRYEFQLIISPLLISNFQHQIQSIQQKQPIQYDEIVKQISINKNIMVIVNNVYISIFYFIPPCLNRLDMSTILQWSNKCKNSNLEYNFAINSLRFQLNNNI